jgi:hypothetical protein
MLYVSLPLISLIITNSFQNYLLKFRQKTYSVLPRISDKLVQFVAKNVISGKNYL